MHDLDRAEIAAKRLVGGSPYSMAELTDAALAVLVRNDPPRDRIVLEEAKRRRAKQSDQAAAAWSLVRSVMEDTTPPASFEIWIERLDLVGQKGSTLVLAAPPVAVAWIERRYAKRMLEALIELTAFTDLEIQTTAQRRAP